MWEDWILFSVLVFFSFPPCLPLPLSDLWTSPKIISRYMEHGIANYHLHNWCKFRMQVMSNKDDWSSSFMPPLDKQSHAGFLRFGEDSQGTLVFLRFRLRRLDCYLSNTVVVIGIFYWNRLEFGADFPQVKLKGIPWQKNKSHLGFKLLRIYTGLFAKY